MKRFLFAGASLALWRALCRRAPVDLRGKVVIVTGASSGIGLETARRFSAEGARVVLAARRAEVLRRVAAELEAAHGTPVLAVPVDLTKEEDRRALIDAARRAFGRVDVLVNNAGITHIGRFHRHDPDHLYQLVQLNLYAYMRLTQLVLPAMLRRGAGHIVYVSSVTGRIPFPGLIGYTASRAGVVGLAGALRRELVGTGVHVSLVLPTWTRTPIASKEEFDMVARFGIPVETVDRPTAAIVDAVRYRRREVMLGGARMKLALLVEKFAARLIDWFISALLALFPDAREMLYRDRGATGTDN
jgi:short-subunit dehydrogenase